MNAAQRRRASTIAASFATVRKFRIVETIPSRARRAAIASPSSVGALESRLQCRRRQAVGRTDVDAAQQRDGGRR